MILFFDKSQDGYLARQKGDIDGERGMRNVKDGEVELLQGFEFNAGGKQTTAMYAPYEATINRATGQVAIAVPAFVPGHMIAVPRGATHTALVLSLLMSLSISVF